MKSKLHHCELGDWQDTQNKDYLALLNKRLNEPRLIWVDQFIDLIYMWLEDAYGGILDRPLRINDFGCNVGHFYRGCKDLLKDFSYVGYDISETYLTIAKSSFEKSGNNLFNLLDFSLVSSKPRIRFADISVISATLEHIQDYREAIENIFSSTGSLVLMRTFVGNDQLSDYCMTDGAQSKYLIRQFKIEDLIVKPRSKGWSFDLVQDKATLGHSKFVCNGRTIPRSQFILVFKK
jgi:SAM-dependent methyltransferase